MAAGNWYTADREWSRYWSNGPAEVHAAITAPPVEVRPVRTLEDMDAAEVEALEALYRCPVLDRDRLPAFRA